MAVEIVRPARCASCRVHDTQAMNAHLAGISRNNVAPGTRAPLLLDGAGWHNFGTLIVPDNVILMPLPPYSPELNPVETPRRYLRQNDMANRVFDGCEANIDVCCTAWNTLIAMPDGLAPPPRLGPGQ